MSETKTGSKSNWRGPLLCLGLGLLPVASVLVSGFIAVMLGCRFDASGTDPCIRAGIPFGSILYPFGAAGWLAMLTVPLGVLAAIILSVKNLLTKRADKNGE